MFTFKTEKPSGKWKSFQSDTVHIKLKRRKVGMIGSERPHSVSLMVEKKDINEDGNPNCSWKWITFKKDSDSIAEAKKWLCDSFKEITSRYTLFLLEND